MPELTLYDTGYGTTTIKKGKKSVEVKFSYEMEGGNCTLFPLQDEDGNDDNFEGQVVTVGVPNIHSNDIENLADEGFTLPPQVLGKHQQKLTEWHEARAAEEEMDVEENPEEDEEEFVEDADPFGEEEPELEAGRKKAWSAGRSKKFSTNPLHIPTTGTGTGSSHKRMGSVLHKRTATKTNIFADYHDVVTNLTEEEALACLIWRDDLNSYTLRFINRLNGHSEQREYKVDIDTDNETLIFNDNTPVPKSSAYPGIAYAKVSDPGRPFDFDQLDVRELQFPKAEFCQLVQEINDEDIAEIQVAAVDEAVTIMVNLRDTNQLPNQTDTSAPNAALSISSSAPSRAVQPQTDREAKEYKKIFPDLAKTLLEGVKSELAKDTDFQGQKITDDFILSKINGYKDPGKPDGNYIFEVPDEVNNPWLSKKTVVTNSKIKFNENSGYLVGDVIKVKDGVMNFNTRGVAALFVTQFYNLYVIQQCPLPLTITINYTKMGIPNDQNLRNEVFNLIEDQVKKISRQLDIPTNTDGLSMRDPTLINVVYADAPAPAPTQQQPPSNPPNPRQRTT